MNYVYEGYNIEITDNYYLISKTLDNGGYTRLSQTMLDSPFEGNTLQEKAEAHVDELIKIAGQEQQEQATLEEVKSTVDYHDEVITDAILRGIL